MEKEGGKYPENRRENRYTDVPDSVRQEGLVQDSAASEAWHSDRKKKRGQVEYTIKDYLALPEGERWELIDGRLIRMESPTTVHQFICAKLLTVLNSCIDEHELPCLALAAPTDVQLDMDDRTIVVPDLIVLCDLKKLRKKLVYGAPDMVVEILSSSTQSRDMVWKNQKYQFAGVREYWIVNPDEKKIIVNLFTEPKGAFVSRIYDFEEKIPVAISEGKCEIDFSEIKRKMEKLYGN